MMPRPSSHRMVLYYSASQLLARHMLSDRSEDLDQSIGHFTEANRLPLRVWYEPTVDTTQLFFRLAQALLLRSLKFERPNDADDAIRYFHCLRGHSLDNTGISRSQVNSSLVGALVIRAKVGTRDPTWDLDELIALCHDPFTLDVTADSATPALEIVAGFILIKGPPSDKSINSLREASGLCPNSRTLSFALAGSLARRFFQAPTDHDYEEAAAILSKIIASPGTGDRPDNWWDMSTRLIVPLATARSTYYRKLEYAEEAMTHIRALLDSPFLSDEDRRSAIKNLEKLANNRFWCFTYGDSSALKEALSLDPEAIRISPSWHSDSPEGVAADTGNNVASRPTDEAERSTQRLQDRLSTISPGDQEYNQCLSDIWKAYNTKISRTNDTTDIEEAIKYFRSLLDQTPPGNASSIRMATFLGYFHGCLFQRTQKPEDLVESIDLLRGVLKVPAGQEFAEVVGGMVTSILVYRLHSAHSDPDKDEANQAIDDYFHLITDNIYTPVPRRLVLACLWAQWSRETGLPSVSTAYDKAMSLLQESVMFAPVLQVQHTHLVSMLSVAKELPLDYASYLVYTDQVKQAIETLERGRALFWSELRGFRTSIDQLSMVDLLLAERFTAINQDLERLTMSPLPNSSAEVTDIEPTYREGVDPFGRVLLRQRRLLEERDRAISQVQTLPGFENFLKTFSFDTLRSAASHGPVIVINHSKWRSDILILLYDSPPSLVLTSEGFYDHAIRLRDKLIDARKNSCLDSKSYGRALASVLADLYQLVGRPVINRLRELKIPEQSRVWWCPTSVFCSLPLHAMGPIPSDDGVKRYFFDLFIPSYTPTISALIEARKADSEPPKQPSLLLVAQPLPGVKEEIGVVQGLDIEVEGLLLEDATTATVVEGLGRHRLVHFACHGNLERGKPFDASFKLHGGEPLTLLDIVHSRLPTAEFAFLSACHTAELTEGSIADEGLHLTAALQYCGFRSVVGTMWEMADTDGHDLARHFYPFLFSKKNGDVPYYERSAKALRDAVRKLRSTKGVTLERWVNFVHYGA